MFSLFTELPVTSQESERSWICVLGVSTFPLSTIFLLYFGVLFFVFITSSKNTL